MRPITTTLDEAKRLGAMALFGEKYGEVVRMVEIGEGEYSRELCGGTHVRSTAEIGVFRVLCETSSAANVRRIEALTGPAAVELLREHDRAAAAVAATLRTRPSGAPRWCASTSAERKRSRRLAGGARRPRDGAWTSTALVGCGRAESTGATRARRDGARSPDAKALLDVLDRLKGKLRATAAIVLGAAIEAACQLVASVAPALVERGVKGGGDRQGGRRGRRRRRRRTRHDGPGGRRDPAPDEARGERARARRCAARDRGRR